MNRDTFRKQPVFDLGPVNAWFCDKCGAHGDAIFGPDATVKDAIEKIRDAHALAEPDCIRGTTFIRLVNLERLKEKGLIA